MQTVEKQRGWVSKIIGIFAFYRTALTAWAAAVLLKYPFAALNWSAPVLELYLRASGNSIFRIPFIQDWIVWPWYRWDAVWYIRIAAEGYSAGGSTAFPPVYPALIRLLGGLLGGNLILAALVVSTAALGASCVLLFLEARLHFDASVAARSVVYFLAFLTAFFLTGAYSESLFVLLVLLAWRFARRNQWLWAAAAAALSAMTRFQGAALFIPLFYLWWRSPKPRSRSWPALVFIPLIPLIWSFILGACLRLDSPWQVLADDFHLQWSWPWTGIIGNLRVLLGLQPYGTGWFGVALDLALTLAALALLLKAIRDLPPEYALLSAVLILPALMKVHPDGLLVSMSRYVVTLWPNFIVLGILGGKRLFHWAYVCTAMVLQAVASALFFMWYWVA